MFRQLTVAPGYAINRASRTRSSRDRIPGMKTCALLWVFIAATVVNANENPTVVGNGWGLDHVIISVSNSEAANRIYADKLGFTPFVGNKLVSEGLDQAIIELPPGYLELLWPFREPAADARPIANTVRKIVETGGGIASYNIDVSPVEQTVDAMRRLNLHAVVKPSRVTQTVDGKQVPAWQFADVDPQDLAQPRGVPGGKGVGFLEYGVNSLDPGRFKKLQTRAEKEVPDPRRSSGEVHANSARTLRSVWVAVPSVKEAVDQSARFGFVPRTKRKSKTLGEEGQEVQCGEGTLIFFEATHQGSSLAAFVKRHGLGPFGISVEVADIKTAQRIIEHGMQTRFNIQRNGKERSFVVPEQMAGGLYIEFVQRPQ